MEEKHKNKTNMLPSNSSDYAQSGVIDYAVPVLFLKRKY